MNAREAIKYWKVFLKEIAFLKREHSSVDWEEQERATKMAIEALEKQIPKKIIAFDDGSGKCPVCGEKLHTGFMDSNYCHWCGQALKEF